MKFSERWLREWVDPPVDTGTLVEQLTTAGLEVDTVEPVAPPLDGIVVGQVLSVAPHPDADRLRLCRVDVGEENPLDIVCGASNVHSGMRVPTALVGSVMPDGMKIKKTKLRGVESFGMLCSEKELGLAETASGLMPLPTDAPAGMPVADYLMLHDVSIDVDLTPNRGDCLGIAGIAREVGVINRLPVTYPAMEPVAPVVEDRLTVRVDAPADCPRYVGRVIRDVDTSAGTPLWMQEKLRRGGLRSIGAIVDVTNYVLLELGQPMHAFDLERVSGGIVVRRAAPGESIDLLDDSSVSLDPETLVIADGTAPQALAGIMGGRDTAVTRRTRHLFLESAFFSPEAVAGRARRYGKQTDSSHRFERGVDFNAQRRAMERATALILEIAGGHPGPVVEEVADNWLPRRPGIELRRERLRRVLGMEVEPEVVTDILRRLGLDVEGTDTGWWVSPPSFRFDLAIEADLIEEIARVVGYDQLPTAAPIAHLEIRPAPEARVDQNRFRRALVERGYYEAITYSFVDPELQSRLVPDEPSITLANPLAADMSVMRSSLWSGLIQAMRYNLNRQQDSIRLFETGLRFLQRDGETLQQPMLAGIAAGFAAGEHWDREPRPAMDFFAVKGDVEALLAATGASDEYRFEVGAHPALHPGQTAGILRNGEPVGLLGALHPGQAESLDLIGTPVYLFELDLSILSHGRVARFQPLSRFPAIRRDIAIVVNETVSAQAVRDCIGQAAPDMLKNLQLFDVYRGEHIDSGKKSMALGLTLQAPSKTLTDQEVEAVVGNVVMALQERLGASLRG